MLKVIAFDCFGTVFDMAGISRDEIGDYVRHVRQNDFTPYKFPPSWLALPLHTDSAEGVQLLQAAGYKCVTLSNGAADLLGLVSRRGGLFWDNIIDLAAHRVYKPHVDAYRTVQKEMNVKPAETLMVTANPTFGDIEGAAAIGMPSQVIRQADGPANIIELARWLERKK
jgi:2-haloacid dehalogenase